MTILEMIGAGTVIWLAIGLILAAIFIGARWCGRTIDRFKDYSGAGDGEAMAWMVTTMVLYWPAALFIALKALLRPKGINEGKGK